MKKILSLFWSPADANRQNNINFIRFAAAAMVIYGHMAHLVGAPVPQLFGQEVSTIAVKVFFVLSGYLITKSFVRDENYFRYAIRRIFRIFPGLIFIVLFCIFILGPIASTLSVSDYFQNENTWRYLRNCLLYPIYSLPGVFVDNFYPNAVNGSLWTLPVEFAMYIILPIIYVGLRKLKITQTGIAIIGISILAFNVARLNFFPELRIIIWGSNLVDGCMLASYFFAGALFTFENFRSKLNLQVACFLLAFLAIINLRNYWQWEIALFLFLPYIVLSLSFAQPSIFGRVFAKNDYSYGLYLWGMPVQQLFVYYFGIDFLGLIPYSLLCMVIATLCAMFSWHFIEQPCNKIGKKITNYSKKRASTKRLLEDSLVTD